MRFMSGVDRVMISEVCPCGASCGTWGPPDYWQQFLAEAVAFRENHVDCRREAKRLEDKRQRLREASPGATS